MGVVTGDFICLGKIKHGHILAGRRNAAQDAVVLVFHAVQSLFVFDKSDYMGRDLLIWVDAVHFIDQIDAWQFQVCNLVGGRGRDVVAEPHKTAFGPESRQQVCFVKLQNFGELLCRRGRVGQLQGSGKDGLGLVAAGNDSQIAVINIAAFFFQAVQIETDIELCLVFLGEIVAK